LGVELKSTEIGGNPIVMKQGRLQRWNTFGSKCWG